MNKLTKLRSQLEKIEKELETCRTSTLQDGWQTQKHAKKARKWDILAQKKMTLIQDIQDSEDEIEYQEMIEGSASEACPKCGNTYDDADFDFQLCSICGFDNNTKK